MLPGVQKCHLWEMHLETIAHTTVLGMLHNMSTVTVQTRAQLESHFWPVITVDVTS